MNGFISTALAWALGALAAYGYRIVFAATILENVFLIGNFFPGDVITAAAAVAAGTPQGSHLSPWGLVGVATVGSLIGANVSYLMGRRGGRELIERTGPRFGIRPSAIEATEEYFLHHGSETVFLARFVAVVKNIAPALAGASRMRIFWFELYSLLSALLYSSALVAVGWFLGENFRVGLKYFGGLAWLGLVLLVGVGLALWVGKRRHDRRLVAENAAEFEQEHAETTEEDA